MLPFYRLNFLDDGKAVMVTVHCSPVKESKIMEPTPHIEALIAEAKVAFLTNSALATAHEAWTSVVAKKINDFGIAYAVLGELYSSGELIYFSGCITVQLEDAGPTEMVVAMLLSSGADHIINRIMEETPGYYTLEAVRRDAVYV